MDFPAVLRAAGKRMVTPQDPSHSWLAVARPLVLKAKVSMSQNAAGLVTLLPLIFEKLLGRPLDATPWTVLVIRAIQAEDGNLSVSLALSSAPSNLSEGLFEVGTPLGIATLRLNGLEDTAEIASFEEASEAVKDPVLLLTVPSEWLSSRLIRAAHQCKFLTLDADSPGDGPEWKAWFSQWGEVMELLLLTHTTENKAQLAVAFAKSEDCEDCRKALSGRLLVLKEPLAAVFATTEIVERSALEKKAQQAWSEHLVLEQEIASVDRAMVLQEAIDGIPPGREYCCGPLLELIERWLEAETLHAASTICAQRQLQEADPATRGKSAESYRRSCWLSAFRLALSLRPCKEDITMLALAICEHWQKSQGICLDVDSEELPLLEVALQEAWLLSGKAEDSLRRSAEAEARAAEQALIAELVAEEMEQKRKRGKKTQKEKEKQKRRKPDDKTAVAIAEVAAPVLPPDAGSLATQAEVKETAQPTHVSRKPAKSAREETKKASPPRATATQSGMISDQRPAVNIDAILEAVRKSEELHQTSVQPNRKESRRSSETSSTRGSPNPSDEEGSGPSSVDPAPPVPVTATEVSEDIEDCAEDFNAPEGTELKLNSQDFKAPKGTELKLNPQVPSPLKLPDQEEEEEFHGAPTFAGDADDSLTSPAEECRSPSHSSSRRRKRRSLGSKAVGAGNAPSSSTTEATQYGGFPESKCPSTPVRKSVVTLSDLGLSLGGPVPQTPGLARPAETGAAEFCWSPPVLATMPSQRQAAVAAPMYYDVSPSHWPAVQTWPQYPQIDGSPIMGTVPVQRQYLWATAAPEEASMRSPGPKVDDQYEMVQSWLQASGLRSSGADLAAKLREVAPQSYED